MEQKNISLAEKIAIIPEWLVPDTHSPMRDSLPGNGGTLTIEQLLYYMVALSDNIPATSCCGKPEAPKP